MNKNQFAKIISQRCGIDDKDEEFFSEDFISLLNQKMKFGEIYSMKDAGYFFKNKCKVIDETGLTSGDAIQVKGESEIILFFEEFDFIGDITKALVFFFTFQDVAESSHIDFYYTLSSGKPVVKIQKNIDEVGLVSQDVADHTNKIRTLSVRLFKEMDLLDRRTLEDEIIILKRKSLKLGDGSSSGINLPKPGSEQNAGESGRFIGRYNAVDSKSAFDLYYHSRYSQNGNRDRGLPWNYSRDPFISQSDQPANKDADKKHEPVDNKLNIENKTGGERISPLMKEDASSGAFERVKEFESLPTGKNKSGIDDSNKIKPGFQKINKVSSTDEFLEVKTKTSHLGGITNRKLANQIPESVYGTPLGKSKGFVTDHPGNKRKKFVSIIALLFIAALLIVTVYVIIESGLLFQTESPDENSLAIVRPPTLQVIERNDLIPVSYPYEKQTETESISSIAPDAFEKPKEKIVEQKQVTQNIELDKKKTEPVVKQKSTVNTEKIPDRKIEETNQNTVKNNESIGLKIFPYKDYFVVQVGSYSTFDNADTEAEKFRKLGYNAFVEVAQVSGKTVYRLRVGDFTSKEQAERFSRKYNQ